MPFTIDFDEGTPVRWTTDSAGATATRDPDYRPALYAAARGDRTRYLGWLADTLAGDPKVVSTGRERHRKTLRADEPSSMLRVSVERVDEVRQVAREIRWREHETHPPGTLSLYDVDLDPGFRYCLDTGRDPVPDRELRTLSLSLPERALADDDLSALRIDGGPTDAAGRVSARPSAGARSSTQSVRSRLERELAERDPDVLVVSSGDIVPLLADAGVDIGRRPGYRKLAGESTYASYGRVGHSPARYSVPGRAIVDRSNSFLLGKSGLAGIDYFVERAGKPIQEVARDSIGGVLTAIEVRKARERGVRAPWQKRQTEGWKSVDRLRTADRGGTTLQPDVGVHEGVHELDFASLYPNIIREYNVSPETVRCDCHDTDDVPELDYSVCEREGFLGGVLGPLLDDRRRWKRRLRTGDVGGGVGADGDADADESGATLEAKVDAVKWVLVSSFGYQGYRHAKFGRIETHEAINAYAREVLLDAKAAFEAAGWRVVHGIVDSLWVTPDPERDQRPVLEVAREVSADAGIELEHEGRLDWVAFLPRKRASGGALMRYFGRWDDQTVAGGRDRYKFRGIEARQRSTCAFVADAQRDLVATFGRERTPEAVCERLRGHLAALRRGSVPARELVVRQRVSKRRGEYEQATRAAAALERAAERGVERHPGQSVAYVVVDDDADGPERVRLSFEFDGEGTAGDADGRGADGRNAADGAVDYDADWYVDRLVRACESVVAPLGWDRTRVRRYLRADRDATLASFKERSATVRFQTGKPTASGWPTGPADSSG